MAYDDACPPALRLGGRSGLAEMQSCVLTHHTETAPFSDHARRLAAARVLGTPGARNTFLEQLLQDADICDAARRSFLKRLQETIQGPLFDLAAEEALCTILRTAFRRLDHLLLWDPKRSSLVSWWSFQATFEFNNDGRRQAEQACGVWRRANGKTTLELVSLDSPDSPADLAAPDGLGDPAARWEHQQDNVRQKLQDQLEGTIDPRLVLWLRGWLEKEALDAAQPLIRSPEGVKLRWAYGAQGRLAALEGVSDRTLRNRAKLVEAALSQALLLQDAPPFRIGA